MVQILILIQSTNEHYEKIVTELSGKDINPLITDNYNDFLLSITKDEGKQMVVILFIENENDLNYLTKLQRILAPFRVIIILPEKRVDMVTEALILNPVVLLFASESIYNIKSMLEKIVTESTG